MIKKRYQLIICMLFLLTIIVPLTHSYISNSNYFSNRNILYVGGTGEGNYTSIQNAIDAASNGNTIFVYSGNYFENILIYKSLILKGEDKSTTVIQNLSYENTIELTSEQVQIHNFSIMHTGNSSNFYAIGINIRANHVHIENNIITAGFKGISATDRENISITGNIINNSKQALYLWKCQQNTICNNIFSNLTSYSFRLDHCNNSYINSNKIINGSAISLYHVYSTNSTIINNLLSSNTNGMHLSGSFNNLIKNNTITHNQNTGIVLLSSHHCVIKNNHINNNDIGINIASGSHNNTISQNNIEENVYYGIKIHTGYQQSTHYATPTKTGTYLNEWSNPIQAYSSDDLYATAQAVNLTQDYTSFDFNIPANTSSTYIEILGITVYIEGHGENETSNHLRCGIRSDQWGENIWADEENWIVIGDGTDEEISVGGDTWDTEWYAEDFINGNFYVRIMTDTNPSLVSIDRIRVGVNYRAYHQCLDNTIFHNAFSNNWYHGRDECSNQWNRYIIPEGNYYDSYQGTDLDNNGIGDNPYLISGGNNQDLYPLINPYGSITNLDTGEIFLTIQEAIDDTDTLNGHTIYVKNGTYYENIIINKSIELKGEHKEQTIIIGNVTNDICAFRVMQPNIIISNVTLKRDDFQSNLKTMIQPNDLFFSNHDSKYGLYEGIAIDVNADNTIFSHCIMKNYTFDHAAGFWIYSNNNSIKNCIMDDNPIILSSNGNQENNTIDQCHLTNNSYIILEWTNNAILTDNNFSSGGIYIVGGSTQSNYIHTIQNNTINDKPILYLKNQQNQFITGSYGQVLLVNCNNMTIQNVTFENVIEGILTAFCSNITIHYCMFTNIGGNECYVTTNLNITNCSYSSTIMALYIHDSTTSIKNCLITENEVGIALIDCIASIVNNNISFSNEKGVGILGLSDSNISDNIISNNQYEGIHILHSTNNTIMNNSIINNFDGIELDDSSHINISKNEILSNQNGIIIKDESNFNQILNNIISENIDGIGIQNSNNNTIRMNNISMNSDDGIHLYNATYNLITSNNIFDNQLSGIEISIDAKNNSIYHNNFINNSPNAFSNDININSWDNGYPSGGNYWDDYTGIDTNNDGIGESSYNISNGNNQDNYPFTHPYGWLIELDINQSTHDRGFPIRHAADGDWGAAQNFNPNYDILSYTQIYIRKFGSPEFNLTVELRENAINGPILDTLVFTPSEIENTWIWLELDFSDTTITPGTDYFIKCPPAPSGITTSFGYEWGYAFGNQYNDGAFWFTRDGGNLWRDLPTMYEFVFITYGYN